MMAIMAMLNAAHNQVVRSRKIVIFRDWRASPPWTGTPERRKTIGAIDVSRIGRTIAVRGSRVLVNPSTTIVCQYMKSQRMLLNYTSSSHWQIHVNQNLGGILVNRVSSLFRWLSLLCYSCYTFILWNLFRQSNVSQHRVQLHSMFPIERCESKIDDCSIFRLYNWLQWPGHAKGSLHKTKAVKR